MHLLGLCVLMALPAPLAAPRPPEPQVVHLLNRLAFGPSPQDMDEVEQLGVKGWIEKQLHPDTFSDHAVELALGGLPALTLSSAELHERYPRKDEKQEQDKPGADVRQFFENHPAAEMGRQVAAQRIIRAVESRKQLTEVLTDFWFNHFNVAAQKGRVAWYLIPYERDVIRPHLFGKFRELLGATAHSPAMLFYLDNWTSVRDGLQRGVTEDGQPRVLGLNENYARELMELHTLGVHGGYTQKDVHEVARAFTGWSIDKPGQGGEFLYRPRTHDDDSKQILTLPLAGGGGEADGEAVLDFLSRQPATARHLAFQLCQRFVSDQPPPALVERIAQVYLKTDGQLTEVYRALFKSPEFWAATEKKTKTPFELVVSALRSMEGSVDGGSEKSRGVMRTLSQMGEPLYQALPPTGYSNTAETWVSAGALVQRINFGIALAHGRVRGAHVTLPELPPDSDAEAAVDTLALRILHRPLTAPTRRTIVSALNARRDPSLDPQPLPLDVPKAVGLLWGSPEFQKR